MTRDEDKKARLTVGESALHNRVNRVIEVHRNSSSASRGSGLRPPLFPLGSAALPRLKELLVLTLELGVEADATDARALFAQALGLLEVGAIDLRVVHQLARPVHGETGVAGASNAGVELLPGFWLL